MRSPLLRRGSKQLEVNPLAELLNAKPVADTPWRVCGQCGSRYATLECEQCEEMFCSACGIAFHRRGRMREHRMVPVSAHPNVELKTRCQEHDEQLQFFCTQCRETVCAKCIIGTDAKHRGHPTQDMEVVLQETQDMIKKNLGPLRDIAYALTDNEAKYRREREEVHADCEAFRRNKTEQFKQLHVMLNEAEERVERNVQGLEDQYDQQLEGQIEETSYLFQRLEETVILCERLSKADDTFDFLDHVREVETRISAGLEVDAKHRKPVKLPSDEMDTFRTAAAISELDVVKPLVSETQTVLFGGSRGGFCGVSGEAGVNFSVEKLRLLDDSYWFPGSSNATGYVCLNFEVVSRLMKLKLKNYKSQEVQVFYKKLLCDPWKPLIEKETKAKPRNISYYTFQEKHIQAQYLKVWVSGSGPGNSASLCWVQVYGVKMSPDQGTESNE